MRAAVLTVAALACAAVAAPVTAVAAAPARIVVSGSLAGHAGMVVLAVDRTGAAKGARLSNSGTFSLQLPKATAHDATLQLIAPDGRYFGPVVLGVGSKRAYGSLAGSSVNVGALLLKDGYARTKKSLPKGAIDSAKWSQSDANGKPVGAGRLGMVRMAAKPKAALTAALPGGAPGAGNPGDDTDGDGVPSLFDADDNGNGTLDSVDPASAQGNAGLYSILSAPVTRTLNANTSGVTSEQIDDLFTADNAFTLGFYFDDRNRPVASADVDCYALVYCARGGGTAVMNGPPSQGDTAPPLWTDYSPNGTGLPNLINDRPHAWSIGVQPRVSTAQIHPGDTFGVNFRLSGGEVITVPTSLSAYFVTTPAITHWATSDASADITYPVTDPAVGELTAPDGHLALTFWRPQRMAIPGTGETGLIDMGHLHWGVSMGVQGHMEFGCGGYFSGYSASLHNDYTPASKDKGLSLFPLHDSTNDAAPNPAHTLSLSVDLAGCLQHAGIDPSGQTVYVKLGGATESRPGGMDRASQELVVHLP